MNRKLTYKNIVWIDLESPTAKEVEELTRSYRIHPMVVQELLSPSYHSKVDVYQDFIFMVLHFPIDNDLREIDFIVGCDFLITTHYEHFDPLNDFAKVLEADFLFKRNEGKIHAGFLLYFLLKEIYTVPELALGFINDKLKAVEKKIFNGEERTTIRSLSEICRELLDYRRALKTHKEILASLEMVGGELFGKEFDYYLKSLRNTADRIWKIVLSNHATFFYLRQTSDSFLAIKTNETMRVLTALAFIFLPLTIISQIFSMNANLPIIGSRYDFYIILLLMAAAVFLLFLVARSRKWL